MRYLPFAFLVVAVPAVAAEPATPIRDSVERLTVSAAVDSRQVGVEGFEDVRPRKGESFFSPQNLLLGAGLAASAWWDVKTSQDCFAIAPVVKTEALPGGGTRTTTYTCVETNPKMAEKFAQGPGAVYREKAIRNGAVWVAGWGMRWAGTKFGFAPLTVLGYAAPAAGIGLQVKWSLGNKKVSRDLKRLR